MSYFLLNSLSPWAFLILFVVAMSFLSSLIFALIKFFFPLEVHKQKTAFIHVLIGVMGVNYAILLSFIVIELWKSYDHAKNIAGTEANHLSLMILDSYALPCPVQSNIINNVGKYVQDVVHDEWEKMKWGNQSQTASDSIISINKVLLAYTPQNETEKTFYNQIVNNLKSVYDNRRLRLNNLDSAFTPYLRFILILNAFLIIMLISLIENKKKYVHWFFTFTISCVLFFNVGLVLLFEYPFSGNLIRSDPFTEGLLARFNKP